MSNGSRALVMNADCFWPHDEPHPYYCSEAVFGRFLSIKRKGMGGHSHDP